jgi:hypothetical protein
MNFTRAVVAGLVATAAVTALWLLEPAVGLPRLAVGSMLSSVLAVATAYLAIGPAVGWLIHAVIGVLFALAYARWFADRSSLAPLTRGIGFGIGLFVLAQITFMPLVGAGFFSRGDLPLLMGSLLGHGVYGGLLGLIYGEGGSPIKP